MKKLIAFYLPQFHRIPENDSWWGNGFTEWTNVKNAKPLFDGHCQPKQPLDDNYYDLLDDKTKEWQIKIAKENGLYGFCFYHYWFNGKLMLEKPLEQFLKNKSLQMNYCLCWANPPWTKIWAGKGSEILINQEYGDEEQWAKHIDYLLPFFRDERYIKENGCPFLVIYSPLEIPCLSQMIAYIRTRIVEEGFPGIKIVYQYYVDPKSEKKILPLFDYHIRFQPIYALNQNERKGFKGFLVKIAKKIDTLYKKIFKKSAGDKLLKLRISNYDEVWKTILNERINDKKYIPGAFVAWDNTPRRGHAGRVITGSTPVKFKNYLKQLVKKADRECSSEFLFLTAWNEWSEGSYLEPDKENRMGYLNAIKEAIVELENNE